MKTSMFSEASLLQRQTNMRVGICIAVGLGVVACSTGSSKTGSQDASMNMQLGIICSTFYSSSGTFAPNTADPPPSGFSGCWPIGAWTFSLTKSTDAMTGGGTDTCATDNHEPTPLAMYQFT